MFAHEVNLRSFLSELNIDAQNGLIHLSDGTDRFRFKTNYV